MNVYFDNAATTRVREEVIDEVSSVLKNCFGNPSSTHSFGRSAKSYIETSRKTIAKILNCEPGEIIFNSGGTESDNSILKCAVKDLGVTLTSKLHWKPHIVNITKKAFHAAYKILFSFTTNKLSILLLAFKN